MQFQLGETDNGQIKLLRFRTSPVLRLKQSVTEPLSRYTQHPTATVTHRILAFLHTPLRARSSLPLKSWSFLGAHISRHKLDFLPLQQLGLQNSWIPVQVRFCCFFVYQVKFPCDLHAFLPHVKSCKNKKYDKTMSSSSSCSLNYKVYTHLSWSIWGRLHIIIHYPCRLFHLLTTCCGSGLKWKVPFHAGWAHTHLCEAPEQLYYWNMFLLLL